MREEALLARERGVIFDIGHGAGSFGFHACRGLLAAGFRPDVISSDVHVLNIDGPAFDLLATMSKFLVLGMELNALVAAVTQAPANAIRRPSLGTLAVGSEGDATVVDIEKGTFEFNDTQGERLDADRRLRLKGMVVGGVWWPPTEQTSFGIPPLRTLRPLSCRSEPPPQTCPFSEASELRTPRKDPTTTPQAAGSRRCARR